MIVRFSLENWMSFHELVEFSMVASLERQHGDRIPKVAKYPARILPVAAIYGGNASGKTNFFKALSFIKRLVVEGTRPDGLIPVETFRLDAKGNDRPSRFSIELLINETIYAYSFAVTRKAVLEEKLVQITSATEKVLYDRREGSPNFDDSLKENQFLEFAFRGTRENQLFLTNSVSQQVEDFKPVYDWFEDCLELVAPDSRFAPFEQFLDESNPLFSTMNEMLLLLDTGISHLGEEELPFDSIPLPETLRQKLQEEVDEGMTVRVMGDPANERLLITRKDGELVARKLVTFHTKSDGSEAKFEMKHESDGSQRVIDLLPAFLDLSAEESKKVYVIDEVDRSLHTHLTRRLLEGYLTKCSSSSRSQLLFTTHDVLLMDQALLRRDEMWVAERDDAGHSTLTSFSEYKDVRYDKDIRKSYLQGRLGGIPRLTLGGKLSGACVDKSNLA